MIRGHWTVIGCWLTVFREIIFARNFICLLAFWELIGRLGWIQKRKIKVYLLQDDDFQWVLQPSPEIQAGVSRRTVWSLTFLLPSLSYSSCLYPFLLVWVQKLWNNQMFCITKTNFRFPFCSWEDFTDHQVHVRQFRQHLSSNYRHRFLVQNHVPGRQNRKPITLVFPFVKQNFVHLSLQSIGEVAALGHCWAGEISQPYTLIHPWLYSSCGSLRHNK